MCIHSYTKQYIHTYIHIYTFVCYKIFPLVTRLRGCVGTPLKHSGEKAPLALFDERPKHCILQKGVYMYVIRDLSDFVHCYAAFPAHVQLRKGKLK